MLINYKEKTALHSRETQQTPLEPSDRGSHRQSLGCDHVACPQIRCAEKAPRHVCCILARNASDPNLIIRKQEGQFQNNWPGLLKSDTD